MIQVFKKNVGPLSMALAVSISLLTNVAQAAPVEAPSQWSKLDLTGVQVNALALDPSTPNLIYAGSNGGGVFQSMDGGQTWAVINNGLGNFFVNALSIDPTNPAIVLAGTGRGPLVGEPSAGVYRTTNRGNTWAAAITMADTLALARTPQNAQVVYAG
ncbi:MAG TPA: hypothetical protein VKX96_01655, partial [Chloroflexota bacterium]|nr:hypothetical protein [Chloroflexota bacterium]